MVVILYHVHLASHELAGIFANIAKKSEFQKGMTLHKTSGIET